MQEWEKKQNRDIEKLGGHPHKGSGNKWYCQSDGHEELFQFEHKSTKTNNDVFHLKSKVIEKISQEARRAGRRPVIILNIDETVWAGTRGQLFTAMSEQVLPQFLTLPLHRSLTIKKDLLMHLAKAYYPGYLGVKLETGELWIFTPIEVFEIMLRNWSKLIGESPP